MGRPRDPQLDRSILAATRELLAETGYQKATITAIARRAGVGTAAIYRRWATMEAIVEDAIFGRRDAELPAATGALRETCWRGRGCSSTGPRNRPPVRRSRI
ncbi:helix-turn-helix domain-containing protein [Rhodococcus sp. 7Tela_A2]|uniref:helix-turn-helix domain-containing protein n=1 Tax=Rhodococcus sp. 7Tela_A2 TaxID=3093744 RepID=UPI003BB6B62A